MISLEGGGECVTKRSCTARANTTIGSSKEWYKNRGLWGLQSDDANTNPFATWNQVFVPYCSGDLFFGLDESSNERAWGLQFSGFQSLKAVLSELIKRHKFGNAQHILYSGESAGGIGAVATADFVADTLKLTAATAYFSQTGVDSDPNKKPSLNATALARLLSAARGGERLIGGRDYNAVTPVFPPHGAALADCGREESACSVTLSLLESLQHFNGPSFATAPVAGAYFSNEAVYKPVAPDDPPAVAYIPWANKDLQKYMVLWNAFVPTRCAREPQGRPWECMFLERSYATMVSDIFTIQAQTDSVVMPLHAALPPLWSATPARCNSTLSNCPATARDFIVTWSHNMRQTLVPILKHTKSNRDGMFFAACLTHTGFGVKAPLIKNTNFLTATYAWFMVDRRDQIFIDNCPADSAFCGKCAS